MEDVKYLLLNAGYWEHNADWNFKDVNSPFSRLYLVTRGEAKIIIHKKQYDLKPGSLFLVPAFVTHTNVCDGRFALYYFHFYERTREQDGLSLYDNWRFPFSIKQTVLHEFLLKRLYLINQGHELKDCDPSIYNNPTGFMNSLLAYQALGYSVHLETDGILRQILAQFIENATDKMIIEDHRIRKSVQYIHTHLQETISLDLLASQLLLSKDYFIKIFRKQMKCTPKEYIYQKKIEKSQIYLLLEGKTIKEVVRMLGFYDSSHFYKMFKKITHITPSEYLEKNNLNKKNDEI